MARCPRLKRTPRWRGSPAAITKVLVATTVIEVGVNVPNATIMVVERAEVFGLAQLHQLRGRVGRGTGASTCLLMYQAPLSETGRRRLQVIRDTEDGFRIAEEDLAMRGAGDLIGTAQSGLPRFRVADLERQAALMAIAQSDAPQAVERRPWPDLAPWRGGTAFVVAAGSGPRHQADFGRLARFRLCRIAPALFRFVLECSHLVLYFWLTL